MNFSSKTPNREAESFATLSESVTGSATPLWLTAHPRRTRIVPMSANLTSRLGNVVPDGPVGAGEKPRLAGCLVAGGKWLPTPIGVSSLRDSKQGGSGGPDQSDFRTPLGSKLEIDRSSPRYHNFQSPNPLIGTETVSTSLPLRSSGRGLRAVLDWAGRRGCE